MSRRLASRCLTQAYRIRGRISLVHSQIRLQHGSSESTQSLSPLLIHSLFPTCSSCGIKLQSEDESQEGYFVAPCATSSGEAPLRKKKEDEVYDKYLSHLSEEDKLLLNYEDSVSSYKKLKPQRQIVDPSGSPKLECLRCRNVKYQSKYHDKNLQETFPIESIESILNGIPPDGQLVYVLSAQDFPMSLDDQVFKYRPALEMKFLINKNDLLFPSLNVAQKYGLTFFRDYLWRKYRVSPENVEVTSGLKDWNITKLVNFFGKESYLIGYVNSGKSTIIQSILYQKSLQKLEKRMSGDKDKREMEKLEDLRINNRDMFNHKSRHVKRRRVEQFKATNGPGASHMPGFTRGHIPYDITDNVTIYDVPGFNRHQAEDHGIYHLIDSRYLKQLSKGVHTFQKGIYKSKYVTIRDSQVITVGGIFLLQAPDKESKTMIQVRNCINFEPHVFSSLEKYHSVAANIVNYPSLVNKFALRHEEIGQIAYQKYIIPPFFGSIDLVIRNVGYVNLTATGSKQEDEPPLVVYLPAGVEAIIRQPITKYTQKTFSGRDRHGNPLRKENLVGKSTLELQRFTGVKPFYSRLIPGDNKGDETQGDLETARRYVQRVKGMVSDDDLMNWIEL